MRRFSVISPRLAKQLFDLSCRTDYLRIFMRRSLPAASQSCRTAFLLHVYTQLQLHARMAEQALLHNWLPGLKNKLDQVR